MATNALVIAVRVEEKVLRTEEILKHGMDKLLAAFHSPEQASAFLAKESKDARLILLQHIPSIRTLDVQPSNKAGRLLGLCRGFIANHEIRGAEGIYQDDDVGEAALEFIEQVCDIVGYDRTKSSDVPEENL